MSDVGLLNEHGALHPRNPNTLTRKGVDNDDGSSNYRIHHNIFFDADGFKMDYGLGF